MVAKVLTLVEVADCLKVSLRHVQNMCANGELPGAFRVGRLWRVSAAQFESWVETASQEWMSQPLRAAPATPTEPIKQAARNARKKAGGRGSIYELWEEMAAKRKLESAEARRKKRAGLD